SRLDADRGLQRAGGQGPERAVGFGVEGQNLAEGAAAGVAGGDEVEHAGAIGPESAEWVEVAVAYGAVGGGGVVDDRAQRLVQEAAVDQALAVAAAALHGQRAIDVAAPAAAEVEL